ncbi:MAG: DUF1788 domain-containing protein [Lentisphaerae bacterium]|nr:DUF1788 domain-containing protein [Lentisphaerota bacterium]
MKHYEEKIEKALLYLHKPGKLSPTGNSPIAYMVYQPEEVFVVRNLLETFLYPKAEYFGFTTHVVSMGELIDKFINSHEYRDIWTDPSVEETEMYNSIKQEIANSDYLEKTLIDIQEEYVQESQPLLVIKDVEMLHPFNMMGVIENKIYNKIKIPMLVLYPGETQGTARSFMGIYSQDGNYRSINF